MSESSLRVDYDPFGERKSRGDGKSRNRPGKRRRRRPKSKKRSWKAVVLKVLAVLAALALPFLLLVRLAVALYSKWGWGNWTAVWGAALVTTVLLLLYAWLIRVRFQGRLTLPRAVLGTVGGIVVAYVVYLLVFLSSANAKSPEIQAEFRSLHPVMRVALSSVLLVDREAMVTDVGRTADDYRAWGLSVNEASLHFDQATGFVHAVDLRTRGRPDWRNTLIAWYFRGMGFRTLRHVGTADHLHVSLPPT